MTAGAIALAVVTPALEPVEQVTVALQVSSPAVPVHSEPARPESARLDPESAFSTRAVFAQRASRATIRRTAGVRPGVTPASRRPTRPIARVSRVTGQETQGRDTRSVERARSETSRERVRQPRTVRMKAARRPATRARTVVTRHAAPGSQRVMRLGNMTAVVAYARSQVGRSYVSGGEGASGFDCSGLTKQAYARAGIRLPHSSGAQAARARRISRNQARPGDLVVGRGHVGIYMGKGMMIDAGNHRTGVVYRKLYSGLSVERL